MQGSLLLDIHGTYLTAEDRQILRQPQVAGMILFARNIESPTQVRELCASIRQVRDDLIITVDQEGGRVQRLRHDFVRLPFMGHFEQHANAQALAQACGWLMATEVLNVGIDFSFAPVLDLNYQRSKVIGLRAFSAKPDTVIQLAGAFIQGMRQAGMPAVGKHFPGHGWAEADSHVAIPVDERSFEQISAEDLRPFAALQQQLAGVMPAHVIYPCIDQQPAGFSKIWLEQILRQQIGYQGVIFSDDLSMAGAHVVGDAAARIEAAISAGCDVGLVCNDRASAELALSRLQQLKVTPTDKVQQLRVKHTVDSAYKEQPAFLAAKQLLAQAQLI